MSPVPSRAILAAMLAALIGLGAGPALAQSTVNPPEDAVAAPPVPPNPADMWRGVRDAQAGRVALTDPAAAILIQPDGEFWSRRNAVIVKPAGIAALVAAVAAVLAVVLSRGRIRLPEGGSRRTVARLGHWERTVHWVVGLSFILLALTGFLITYGRHALGPLVGPAVLADVALAAKTIHDFVAFAFVAGLVAMAALWGRHALPDRHDGPWLARGGGLLDPGDMPPAGRLNAGQKLMFWLVMLGGLTLTVTGLALLFPFLFTDVFGMQAMQLLHAGTAMVLTALAVVHVYLGTVGVEGAFAAVGSGRVSRAWAKLHHSKWLEGREDDDGDEADEPDNGERRA